MNALVDNDILFKGACYGLIHELVGIEPPLVGVLGAARFVLPLKIRRAQLVGSREGALIELGKFLERSQHLEPVQAEQVFAADLEAAAQKMGERLHIGESQLCAILIHRSVPALLTGDKRAIGVLEKLLSVEPRLCELAGKTRCLEQLVLALVRAWGVIRVRSAVCAEPRIDLALSNCFSCTASDAAAAQVLEGLNSYINALRREADRVLSGEN
jgi:hypothetical protein